MYTLADGTQATRRKRIVVTGQSSGSQTDFQIKLAALAHEEAMQSGFNDLRFIKVDMQTLIDAWLEDKTDNTSADIWGEFPTTPANGVMEDYWMYYGNDGAASNWSGANTFLQYHGATSSSYRDSVVVNPTNVVYEGRIRSTAYPHYLMFGLSNFDVGHFSGDGILISSFTTLNAMEFITQKDDVATWCRANTHFQTDQWCRLKITNDGITAHGYVDGNEIATGSTTNIPTNNLGLWARTSTGTMEQEWAFARKYAANPPTAAFGTEEHQRRTPMMM